jgi:hypothetical protein
MSYMACIMSYVMIYVISHHLFGLHPTGVGSRSIKHDVLLYVSYTTVCEIIRHISYLLINMYMGYAGFH